MMDFFAWKLSDQHVIPFMGPQILQVAWMGKIYALDSWKKKMPNLILQTSLS